MDERKGMKAEFLFSRCGVPLDEASIIDLRAMGLVSLKGLDQCPRLSSLFVGQNKLTSLEGMGACSQLWRVDVSGNKLESLLPLPDLPCLGYLNISNTGLKFKDLVCLRSMSIMELEASENPGLIVPGVSQVTHNRLILIHLLPRVWVLNGVYITHEERTAAAALFQNPENHLLDLVRPFVTSGRRPRPWNPAESVGPLQRQFLEILSTHPDRPERIEPYQLRHYASFYSSDALAINHYSAMRTVASRGVPRLYLPPLHAKELLTLLSAADITNVASLLISVAEYNVPREICEEALTVLQIPVPSRVLSDISRLSHVALCSLIHFLYEVVMDCESVTAREVLSAAGAMEGRSSEQSPVVFDASRRYASMDSFQQQIWASFPRAGIVRAPKFDLQAAIEALSTKRFATFPPEDPLLTPEGVTGGVKPVIPAPPLRLTDVAPTGSPAETDTGYDSDPDAASRRADVATTMAAVDEMLALDDIASSTRAQQAQHSLASAHSMRARHAAVLLSRSPLFPPMVIRSGDKMPRRELIVNFVRLYPLLLAAGLADVTGKKATGTLPDRGGGMETTLRLDVVKYDGTSSPQLSPGKLSITVAASARHSVSSPVGSYTARGAGVGVRAPQITIPRPTPTPVAPAAPPVRLHRRAQSMNKSGLASSTGVVNIPIPGEFLEEIRNQRLANVSAPVQTKSGNMAVPLPMAPLRAWVLNGTWDPNFVLASSDIIHAENKAAVLLGALPSADARGGGWAELTEVPYAMVGRTSPQVPDMSPTEEGRGYVVDSVFKTDEVPLAPQTNVTAVALAYLTEGTEYKPVLTQDQPEAMLALPAPPVQPSAARPNRRAEADTGTFLTGVDIPDGEPQAVQSDILPPTITVPPLPTVPLRQTASYTTHLQQTPKLLISSRSGQSEAKAPTQRTGKTADRTWYALPTRQRFLVSADAVPFKGVRTRPIQPPSEVDDEAMGVKSKSVVAAALVPTGVVHGLASSDSLPAFPGNTVKAKTVPKQIPPPSRLGKRQPGIKFGLEVAPLSRPGTGVDGIAAPVGGSEMDIPLFYQSSLSTSQPSALQLPDEPIEVDKDGVYTVPVPGVGRVFASIHGPQPNASLLADFAQLMRSRASPRPPIDDMVKPGTVLTSAGRRSLSQT